MTLSTPSLEPLGELHSPETRQVILDVAERLFAELGVHGTSIRSITKVAKVNLGAINYHFGTKELLVLQVFARRLEPVNFSRLSRLDALEQVADGKALNLESILEAFIRPTIEDEASGERHQAFLQLMSRCLQEPSEELNAFVKRQFDELATRFNKAILRAVPTMAHEDLFWQMSYLCGGLHHTLAVWARFDSYPMVGWEGERPQRPDREAFIQSLVACAAAGMLAYSAKINQGNSASESETLPKALTL